MEPIELHTKTLLLVEDDQLLALHTTTILEQNGFTTLHADSGEAAVAKARHNPEIDLVLMDIDLGSGIDGTEAARRILRSRELPIVFLTSHQEQEYVASVERITRYGYVRKDSGEFVLIQSIKMAFELFAAHQQTRANERRLAHIIDDAPIGIYRSWSTGTYEAMNHEMARILGFASPDEAIRHYHDIAAQVYADPAERDKLLAELRRDGTVRDFSMKAVRADGETAFLRVSTRLLDEDPRRGLLMSGFIVDETEQKTAELERRRSQEFLRGVIDALPENIAVLDRHGMIIAVNESWRCFARDNGLSWQDCGIGRSYIETIESAVGPSLEGAEEAAEGLRRLLAGSNEVISLEYPCHSPEEQRWFLMEATRFDTAEGTHIVVAHINITHRKLAERRLETVLEDKQRLMDEFTHRVKNNLKDDALGEAADLSDLRSYVRAIALMHDKLAELGSDGLMPFEKYARDLLTGVVSRHAGRPVEAVCHAPGIELPADTALNLGLIISELATNALKHGFDDTTPLRIEVSLTYSPGSEQYTLVVSNTGRPIPEALDLEHASGLGLQLVSAFVSKLRGSMRVTKQPQPAFTIEFPSPSAQRPPALRSGTQNPSSSRDDARRS